MQVSRECKAAIAASTELSEPSLRPLLSWTACYSWQRDAAPRRRLALDLDNRVFSAAESSMAEREGHAQVAMTLNA